MLPRRKPGAGNSEDFSPPDLLRALRDSAVYSFSIAKVDFAAQPVDYIAMRRMAVFLSLLCLAGISTGGLGYLHQKQHQRQAALWAAALQASAGRHDGNPAPPPGNLPDASNCLICLTLHSPITTAPGAIVVAALGLLVISLFLSPRKISVARIALPIDCRGPPNF